MLIGTSNKIIEFNGKIIKLIDIILKKVNLVLIRLTKMPAKYKG